MEWLTNWIFDLFYVIQKTLCYIVDFIKDIFYMLAGIDNVTIEGEETELLSHFLLSNSVKTAFFAIFLIAVIMLVVFVIIAIVRSEYANGRDKKSKSAIIGKAMQSFVIFLTVPFILVAGVSLSNVAVRSINQSMNISTLQEGQDFCIGGQILVTSGQFAYIGDPEMKEQIEIKFITGELDYFDSSVVSQYYKIRDINFLIGIAGSLIITIMFVLSTVTFIQRIFDVVLLYLISPICVSTIPVDDGNRFKIWRDKVISKVLSTYGIILSMNLFFIIIPQVMNINFFVDGFKNGIVQLLFIIGGAFAVTKANYVIIDLTGNDKAMFSETTQLLSNMRTGAAYTKAAGGLAAGGVGAIIGGKRFIDTKKTTRSNMAGFKSVLNKNPMSNQYTNPNTGGKVSKYLGGVSRFATMPIGVIKDIATDGVVGAGKNLVPRMRNIGKGNNIINHPQVRTPKNIDIAINNENDKGTENNENNT